jgi:S1-C subfamily serine protease
VIRGGALAACVVAVVAGSAIGRATARDVRTGAVIVSVEARGLRAATGLVVADGRVVTVAHAVGDEPVVVRRPGGASRRATLVRRDDELELALLAVGGLEHDRAAAAPGRARVVVRRDGATATVPADLRRRIDARVRDAATDEVRRRPVLELAAPIGAGDSGAPVVGSDGSIAGIVFARSRDRDGVAYAVDAPALAAFLGSP